MRSAPIAPDTDSIRARTRRSRLRLLLFVLAVFAAAVVGLGGFHAGPSPAIDLRPARAAIGREAPLEIEVREPSRGLSAVTAELVQGDRRLELVSETPGVVGVASSIDPRSFVIYGVGHGTGSISVIVDGEVRGTIPVTVTPQ